MNEHLLHARLPDVLSGVIAPMFTPIHADGSLDLDGARALAEWLASTGAVTTVFARSGMGRMFSFTVDEVRRFGGVVREATLGRMGMLLGAAGEWLDRDTGGRPDPRRYLDQAIALTRYARQLGAEGAVHVMPEALVPSGGEPPEQTLYDYFRAVHDSTDLPLVIYQPGGLAPEARMTPSLLTRLLSMPRIAGMKVSTTDDAVFGPLADVVRDTPFALICGHEGYYLRGLSQGATGVIGQGCCGYPEILRAVRDCWCAGDARGAATAQGDVERALRATEGLHSAVALKQYFVRKGAALHPYDRGGGEPYPAEVIDRLERQLDALRLPYRTPGAPA